MVRTEMGEKGFQALKEQGIDLPSQTISVEESADSLRKIIEEADLENTHEKFLGPDGKELPW